MKDIITQMNTLSVTKIKIAHGYADVTICEGSRDGFEDMRLTFDSLASEAEAKAGVDAQLKQLAAERGLNY